MVSIQNVNGSHMTIGLPLSLVRWLARMIGLQIKDASTPGNIYFDRVMYALCILLLLC